MTDLTKEDDCPYHEKEGVHRYSVVSRMNPNIPKAIAFLEKFTKPGEFTREEIRFAILMAQRKNFTCRICGRQWEDCW